MTRYVTCLESALDGTQLSADQVAFTHRDRPLWVRYDLKAIQSVVARNQITKREPTLWRYRELLPLDLSLEPISLGEGLTPLLSCPRLGKELRLNSLRIKDESQLPGGSFKSRGMTMAISMAKKFHIKRVALPTAGNAGGAAAAYAARAGIECFVFMPQDTPIVNQLECKLFGAKTFLVDGLINDCGRIVRSGAQKMNWYDLSTLKEPYRLEGKKTMGLELAEQMDWRLPDVILYPTGGGTGLIGMWKAFQELLALGWLESEKLPKMIVVQSEGCAPIVEAYKNKVSFAQPFPNANTIASGLRVPVAVGDFMMLEVIRASGGSAVAVADQVIMAAMKKAVALEGISICPEAAACVAAIPRLLETDLISASDEIVIFNTGAAQKYVEAMKVELPRFRLSEELDWNQLHG